MNVNVLENSHIKFLNAGSPSSVHIMKTGLFLDGCNITELEMKRPCSLLRGGGSQASTSPTEGGENQFEKLMGGARLGDSVPGTEFQQNRPISKVQGDRECQEISEEGVSFEFGPFL